MSVSLFTGRLNSVHSGYGFIGIGSIFQDDRLPTDLDTRHDVYLNQTACASQLTPGMVVEFRVEPDPVKGHGYLRAVGAKEVVEAELVPRTGEVLTGLMPVLSTGLAHPMHAQAKYIPAEAVAKVTTNRPFADISSSTSDDETRRLPDSPEEIASSINGYLGRLYANLAPYGLAFDIRNADDAAENALIATNVTELEELGMNDQALKLRNEHAAYKATRGLLGWLFQQDFFRPGSPVSHSLVRDFVRLAETLKTAGKNSGPTANLSKATGFMMERNILLPNTILPMRSLADLFLAVPVWYLANEDDDIDTALVHNDPPVLRAVRFFCDLLPQNERWGDLFQVFNRRGRSLKHYVGDQIPPHILRVIREARTVFSYVVIMTPYHDVAGSDWQDEAWLRSIDPYVVGFMKDVPYMFVLGRFSDTGLFPLHKELVADTMAYLAANKLRLKNFNTQHHGGKLEGYANWVDDHFRLSEKPDFDFRHKLGSRLICRVDDLLAAFEAGHAFDWLRKEWDLPTGELTRT